MERVNSEKHPLTPANLHQLSPEKQDYLHAGHPESIYNYQYGYYKHLSEGVNAWFERNRKKAQRVVAQYIRVKPEIQSEVEAIAHRDFKSQKVLGIHMRGTGQRHPKQYPDRDEHSQTRSPFSLR